MAFGETADLVARLSLKDQFTGPLKNANRALGQFDAKLTNTQGRAYKAGQQIGTGIKNAAKIGVAAIGTLTGLLVLSAREGQEAQNVQLKYAKAIENSGKVSADYVKILNAQQDALLELSGVDDELIKSAQTRLVLMGLTGEQIAKLTPLALDLATATGKDLTTATIAVGKAAQGSNTALQRMGIIVPKGADAIAILTKRFGGFTASVSGQFDVRLKVLNERLANLREQAGIKLLPVLTKLVDITSSRLVPAFGKLLDNILPGAIAGLDKLASFLSSGDATNGIQSILKTAGAIAPVIQRSAEVTGQVIKTAVNLFRSLPPEIQSLAIAGLAVNKLTGGLVTNIAGGLISAVIASFRGLMNVNAAVVNVNGPVGGIGAGGGAGVLGTAAKIIIPVAIAALIIESAKLFTDALDPTGAKALNDPTGAHGVPLGSRDPRRFNKFGIPVTNVALPVVVKNLGDLPTPDDFVRARIAREGSPISALSKEARGETRTREMLRELFRESRKVRGLAPDAKGPAQSIDNPLRYLASHLSRNAVVVADALAQKFGSSSNPLYGQSRVQTKALHALERLQARFLARGDTKNAEKIGRDIRHMQTVIKARTDAAATKAKASADRQQDALREANRIARQQSTTVKVSVPIQTIINGRLVAANFSRYTTVVGGVVVNGTSFSGVTT